ncbi:GNAT family N-acetyltransferase [Chromobacterium paludis]|uniref:GNAT family N-acetyltransferase n=1 Tax=Chromobacterium paludis TaxID=2605945 RepID=A0A5C1DGL5_9NEIS|nr:GNAT family N-acetyltransferase [Chromobacterium paludis]QEL54758.1 GNAT family N-acetyltransferase [Chromobacterium paludis]
MTKPSFTLRQATLSDEPVAFEIFEAAMKHYVDLTWGWDQNYQRDGHRDHFDPHQHWIASSNKQIVGLISLENHPTHLQLLKLYLLPEFRNRGLGAQILQSVLQQGQNENKPVRLRVLQVNKLAQAFYLRQGLSIVAETPERLYMEHC